MLYGLLILAEVLWLSTCRTLAASAEDTALLLAFKGSFGNTTVLSSWAAKTDPCSWEHIGCNGTGFVERMRLAELGLVGTIPAGVGWVLPESVQYLELYRNRISGSIPAGWRLPASLSTLQLDNNLLSGSISPDWDLSGSQLQYLILNGNSLSGTLPDQWRLPPGLAFLTLSNNSLSGTIPTAFSALNSLSSLSLGFNRLTGRLPSNFTFRFQKDASSPQPALSVQGNLLTGPLPSWPSWPQAQVTVKPGNPELCLDGKMPSAPKYLAVEGIRQFTFLNSSSMPQCYAVAPGSSGSASTGLVVGLGVALGCAAVLAAGGFVYYRRRRGRPAFEDDLQQVTEKRLAGPTSVESEEEERPCDVLEDKCSNASQHGAGRGLPANNDVLLRSILTRIGASNSGGSVRTSGAVTATSSGAATARSSQTGTDSVSSNALNHRSAWRQLGVDVNAFQIPFSELNLERQIGNGSFARVYLGSWRGTTVACKLLLGPEAGSEANVDKVAEQVLSPTNPEIASLEQEASLMAALRHPNVLSFMGLCITPPCLVMKYCPRGSLHSLLHQASTSPEVARRLTWTRRLQMAHGAALGMLYLHSYQPPIIHRDLKSPNVLVESDWTVKISDFNLSKIQEENSPTLQSSTAVGNPRWLAPEVLAGESHTLASDVFSYGLVLWELLTLKAPWEGALSPWQISSQVMAGERPPIPDREQLPGGAASFAGLDDFIALMRECWAQDPQERPLFSEIASRLEAMLGAMTSPAVPGAAAPRLQNIRRVVALSPETVYASPFNKAAQLAPLT